MSTDVEGNDLSGTTLDGRYRLERPLGEGAMGKVYIAHQDDPERRVAIKVLHPRLASEPKHRERFLREARAATRIHHPNVVEMLDFGTTPDDSVYLVMELLHGRDLRSVLEQEGSLPWPRARHLLLQAVAALREAHRQEVIHRDIKPANCFVCDPPEPGAPERMKLLDFGIAKFDPDPSASFAGSGHKPLTQTGELVGTLAYMAPEFADGKPASVHTDMYALGIMAYQLLTGDVPFTGRNEFQVLARHLNEPPVRPRVLVPTLLESVEAVVLTMLAKKPEHRFESMADVEQALLAIPADGSGPRSIVRDGSAGAPTVRRRDSGRAPAVGRARRVTPWPALPAADDSASSPASPPEPPPPPRPDPLLMVEEEPEEGEPTSDVWDIGSAFGPESVEPLEPPVPPEPLPQPEVDPSRRGWGPVATWILVAVVLLTAVALVTVVMQ